MDEFLPGAVVELRAEYVRFLERHILPVVAECEREGRFPREAIRAVPVGGYRAETRTGGFEGPRMMAISTTESAKERTT